MLSRCVRLSLPEHNNVMRRFRLIDELGYSEKKGSAYISYGLDNAEDRTLSKWNASIFGPDGVGEALTRQLSTTDSTR